MGNIHTSVHPPKVSRLHFEFDGWLGDESIETFPCYLVSEELSQKILSANLSGFKVAEAEISISDNFKEIYPNRELPKFLWLKLEGIEKIDDFSFSENYRMVVSERALQIMQSCKLDNADIEEAV